MTLDEIEALTPDVIASLPTERLSELIVEVQTVDLPQEPTPEERDRISAVVTTIHQALHDERLTRSMSLCGGTVAPYLQIRWPGTSATPTPHS